MSETVIQAVHDLLTYQDNIDTILNNFNEHDKLKIMNLVCFGDLDYGCKSYSLMKQMYERKKKKISLD